RSESCPHETSRAPEVKGLRAAAHWRPERGWPARQTVERVTRRLPRPRHHAPEGHMCDHRLSALIVLLSLSSAGTAQAQNDAAQPDYRNAALPAARRVDDLLARMTLEEKVAQMMCVWNAKKQITDAQGRFDPTRAPEWFRVGIGRIERPSDGH